MSLAEKLKDLEAQQAERLAELPALAREFDVAFEAAAGAASGVLDEANRAAASSPRAVEWLWFFACVDPAIHKLLINAVGAAAESAAKRVDGIFAALVESAERHRIKDKRDEMLLDCLRAIASGKQDERGEAAGVAAILEEFDCARALSARQDASGSCKRSRGDDGCGDVEDMETGAPPSPYAVVNAPVAAAKDVVATAAEDVDVADAATVAEDVVATPAEDVDVADAATVAEDVDVTDAATVAEDVDDTDTAATATAAAAASAAAVAAVVGNRAAFAVLSSGPTTLDDEVEKEMMVIETTAGAHVYMQHHAVAVQGNGNGNIDDDENADDADDPNRDAHALFFAHWLPPPTRTPEQIAETLRAPTLQNSAPAWPAEQPPTVFRRFIEAPRGRFSMRFATGSHSVDFSELRTDAGEFVAGVLVFLFWKI